jgi:serine protease DegQ
MASGIELAYQQAEKALREGCVPALLARQGLRPGQRPEVEAELVRQLLGTALRTAKVKLEPAIFVILSNGIRAPATVAKYSPPVVGEAMSGRNLALLRLEAADMPTLALGDSGTSKIGDRLHILGFPGVVLSHELLNASAKVEASVTNGAVSVFKQDVADQPVIQTDAPINVGNSGGALINASGELVGINTAVLAKNLGVEGIGFAIPVNLVRGVMHEILTKGRVVRGWIGIETQDITPELAESFGLAKDSGTIIAGVVRNGPADRAGMRPGDILLTVEGKPVASTSEMLNLIAQLTPGKKATMTVMRKNREAAVEVSVARRPRAQ